MERTLPTIAAAALPAVRHPVLSVFIPARDEAGNLTPLFEKIAQAFHQLGVAGEVVLVDDGSTDSTWAEAVANAERYPFLRLYRHRKSFGLTEAMRTGFRHVRGDFVMFFPADLESDPAEDIPKLYAKLQEGYDVVAGWRQGRADGKVLSSRIYNTVSRYLFNLDAHDMNWIKAFRREVIENLHLRSDWHRFVLMIAAQKGYRIGEVPVNWYPRRQGKSKFGFWRIPISFLDMLVVKFLLTFSKKPMLFFGGMGSLGILSAVVIWGSLTWLYLTTPRGMQIRPVFNFAGFLFVAGILLFIAGFLAELVVTQNDYLEDLDARLHDPSAAEDGTVPDDPATR